MSENEIIVKIEMVVQNAEQYKPVKAHPSDAAFDLFNAGNTVVLPHGGFSLFNAGFKMELPLGWEAQIRPRSGNALKKGITVLNTPGTIDANYRGVVGVILYNASQEDVEIAHGMKIAQMVIQRIPEIRLEFGKVNENTDRGNGGFGSTDKKTN